ncbi:hypothetical protein OXYTRIMIC_546 [Oxytricha trifallax]|uniref:Uncharacterized protein n=1 Tax=Oxytricha trifallax TaxID=1172189 RepID=A0A073HZT6_9SPIT|nr:hypothetical protein OXYTRIMIC_546 [Oxytricha trifallax]
MFGYESDSKYFTEKSFFKLYVKKENIEKAELCQAKVQVAYHYEDQKIIQYELDLENKKYLSQEQCEEILRKIMKMQRKVSQSIKEYNEIETTIQQLNEDRSIEDFMLQFIVPEK